MSTLATFSPIRAYATVVATRLGLSIEFWLYTTGWPVPSGLIGTLAVELGARRWPP